MDNKTSIDNNMSDNIKIHVAFEGKDNFDAVMRLIFQCAAGNKTSHYRLDSKYGMILYWSESEMAEPLPYDMNVDAAIPFVWNWLETAQCEEEPDHDGSNKKGWEIFNEDWGHIDGEWQAFAAIRPCWMMCGK